MQIKYNLTITNPVKDTLIPTNNIKRRSNLKVVKGKRGVSILGTYDNNTTQSIASTYYCLGEKYEITDTGKRNTKFTNYKYLSINDVLKLNKTKYTDIDTLLRSQLLPIIHLKQSLYKLDTVVQYSDDVIVFEINKEGILNLTGIQVNNNTNLFEYKGDNVLIGFLVNKPLTVVPFNDEYYLPNKDLLNLPEGFCTLSIDPLYTEEKLYRVEDNAYIYNSKHSTKLQFSYPLIVDGIEEYSVNLSPYEQYLFTFIDSPVSLSDLPELTLKDNITAIYRLLPKGELEPYLMYCNTKTMTELGIEPITSNYSVRQQTLNSSKENKKRFVVQQYKVNISVTDSIEMTLEDNLFYQHIKQNAIQFNNKVIINDN